jgi:hypothetical protein
MDLTQGFGLLTSIVVLAGISVAIINGGNTAKIIGGGASGFADILRAATLQGSSTKKGK